MLNATPDHEPHVRDRTPESGSGGPGSMNRPDAPEQIFLPWYLRSLGDPAEHEFKLEGWEDVDGHRCLKVRMLWQPRSLLKYLKDQFPTVRIWFDMERGYALRLERYRGDELMSRAEVTRLERLRLPDGRPIWFPKEGKSAVFQKHVDGKFVYAKEPYTHETYNILTDTVKFNQGLSDGFFSAKKHALVVSDEGLRKLQRELDQKPKPRVEKLPSDPESRKKRLDAALAEADRQVERLEASSAARAGVGWFEVLTSGLGVFGVLVLGGVGFWYWRIR
jgi:hypothetical protein